ncbi:MAG TPA: acetamidase/formamidase family protein, partial [Caulobacter sp.]|nr:acetamidase/formamidase family protein [Caulobacter sp.]
MPYRFVPALLALLFAIPAFADPAWTGTWNVSARFAGGEASSAMTLTAGDGRVMGVSGPLDENRFFPLTITGVPVDDAGARLEMRSAGALVGTLAITVHRGALAGTGELYGTPVTLVGVRPDTAPAGPGATYDFRPTTYALQYSARGEPALRIRPGDRVSTSTLDNKGRDSALVWRAMPGNSLTGPFYVEGAMPGDTLAVHIERVALNRDTAEMYSGALDRRAVPGGYVQSPTPGWGRTWTLDRARGVARP